MDRLAQIARGALAPVVVAVMVLLAVGAPLGWGAAVWYYLSAQQTAVALGQAQARLNDPQWIMQTAIQIQQAQQRAQGK